MNLRKGKSLVHELLTRNAGEDREWVHLGFYGTREDAMAHVFETVASMSYNPYSRESSSMTVHVSTCASYHKKATTIIVTDPVEHEQILDYLGRLAGSERIERHRGRIWEYRIQHARVNLIPEAV